jgi:hypothetical protein
VIPHEGLVAHMLEVYGHETAHLDRELQRSIAIEIALSFSDIANEILAERDAPTVIRE